MSMETRDVALARELAAEMARHFDEDPAEFGLSTRITNVRWNQVVGLLDRNLAPPLDSELDAINEKLWMRPLPAVGDRGAWRDFLREIIETFQRTRQGGAAETA